jgi:beta-glucanase (GH16 family)
MSFSFLSARVPFRVHTIHRRRRVVVSVALAAASVAAVIAGTTAGAASSSVSGMSMPGDFKTWQRTFSDDFNGDALDRTKWSPYAGTNKSTSMSHFDRGQTIVSGGILTLRTTFNGTSGMGAGVSQAVSGGQSYGKWVVRMRAQKAAGINYALMLYPENGAWPPEVDFAEDGGGDRTHTTATLHYTPKNLQIHNTLRGVDFSKWHNLGVILTPGHVQYTIDGRVWAEYDSSGVPNEKMWLGIQTGIFNCSDRSISCVDSTTPATTDLQIDWVARYSAR